MSLDQTNLIVGSGPGALAVGAALLERGERVHFIATYLPDGTKSEGAKDPTYIWAAGILQPFGGSDPNDLRLKLFHGSQPKIMSLAKLPSCPAVRECSLRTIVPNGYIRPNWSNLVENYSLSENLETYQTAAFDPPGLMLYQWEQLRLNFPSLMSYDCRELNPREIEFCRKSLTIEGFKRTIVCAGLTGSQEIFDDGTDFPILGVLLHFKGDGQTHCWMNEQRPSGTTGKLEEPDCLYVVRRPRYLGNGNECKDGRIVLGGTIKPNVYELSAADLEKVAAAVLAGCNSQFGENFSSKDILMVSQCRRPGNTKGFHIRVSDQKNFVVARGPAGMGMVMAHAMGVEIADMIC